MLRYDEACFESLLQSSYIEISDEYRFFFFLCRERSFYRVLPNPVQLSTYVSKNTVEKPREQLYADEEIVN